MIWEGQRRFLAGRRQGIEEFECLVYKNIENEKEAREASLKHNLHSKTVHTLDIAEALRAELEDLKKAGEANPRKALEKKFSITKSRLTKYLTIATKLSDEAKKEVSRRNTSFEILYRLAQLPQEEQLKAFFEIHQRGFKRDEAVDYLRLRKKLGPPSKPEGFSKPFILKEEEKIGVQTSIPEKSGFKPIFLEIPERLMTYLTKECSKEGKPIEIVIEERFIKYLAYEFGIRSFH